MNQIGRKIYFELATSNVIIDTGEKMGAVIPATIEEEIAIYRELSERNRDTFDVIELPFGAYAQDFAEGRLIGVNLETKVPVFEYPNPENPDEPIVPLVPLSVEVEALKEKNMILENYILDMDFRFTMKELGL